MKEIRLLPNMPPRPDDPAPGYSPTDERAAFLDEKFISKRLSTSRVSPTTPVFSTTEKNANDMQDIEEEGIQPKSWTQTIIQALLLLVLWALLVYTSLYVKEAGLKYVARHGHNATSNTAAPTVQTYSTIQPTATPVLNTFGLPKLSYFSKPDPPPPVVVEEEKVGIFVHIKETIVAVVKGCCDRIVGFVSKSEEIVENLGVFTPVEKVQEPVNEEVIVVEKRTLSRAVSEALGRVVEMLR